MSLSLALLSYWFSGRFRTALADETKENKHQKNIKFCQAHPSGLWHLVKNNDVQQIPQIQALGFK